MSNIDFSRVKSAEARQQELRNQLHEQRRARRSKAETSGFLYNGILFDSDRDSIMRINNAATSALFAIATGTPWSVVWKSAGTEEVTLDANGMLALQAALTAHGQSCHTNSNSLKESIDTAQDPTSVDLESGWP